MANNFFDSSKVEFGDTDPNPTAFRSTATNTLHVPHVNLDTAIAGERNPDSATASYLVVRQECNVTRCDIDTTETLVTSAPCHVLAVIGNDGNTGYTDLIDAAATGGGSTPKARVNAGDGGTVHLYGARFENGLCVDGESAGHDVTILWRAI